MKFFNYVGGRVIIGLILSLALVGCAKKKEDNSKMLLPIALAGSGGGSPSAPEKPDTGGTSSETKKPTITSFNPTSGLIGAPLVIKGTGFSLNPSENIVKFNGTMAIITEATSTSLMAKVPENAVTGKLSVTISNNTIETSSSFEVIIPKTIAVSTEYTTGSFYSDSDYTVYTTEGSAAWYTATVESGKTYSLYWYNNYDFFCTDEEDCLFQDGIKITIYKSDLTTTYFSSVTHSKDYTGSKFTPTTNETIYIKVESTGSSDSFGIKLVIGDSDLAPSIVIARK